MIVAIDVSSNSAQRAFDLSAAAITGKSTHRLVSGPPGWTNSFMSICADTGTIFPLR
ncbi:adhesion component ABC transporter permease [Mycobacterium tuberculosis variant bovis BCG]|nr:adhesion component ABC transporter permease [Mycobacterium tuberculosis variant bovis BCG]